MSNFSLKCIRPVLFSMLVGQIHSKSVQSINQDFSAAGRDILALVLDNSQHFVNVLNHGCWCQKLDPNSNHDMLGGYDTVDDLDRICKQWFTARRCIQNHEGPGGSCLNYNGGLYQVDGDKCSKKDNDECEQDSCKIDLEYSSRISAFLSSTSNFLANTPTDCPVAHNSINPVQQYCHGDAPDVFLSNEVPKAPEPAQTMEQICTEAEFDVTLLVDGSGSINDEEWEKTMDFVTSITEAFDIGQFTTKVTLAQYSFNMKFYTRFSKRPELVVSKLEEMRNDQYRGATMTNVALNGIMRNIATYGRPGVPQILIMLTDGASSRGLLFPDRTHPQRYDTAERLHELGVTSFVISVGDRVSHEENEQIASDPDSTFYSSVDDFDAFATLKTSIGTLACGLGRTAGLEKPHFTAEGLNASQDTVEESTTDIYGIEEIDGED